MFWFVGPVNRSENREMSSTSAPSAGISEPISGNPGQVVNVKEFQVGKIAISSQYVKQVIFTLTNSKDEINKETVRI